MGRWERDMKSSDDKQQVRFNVGGWLEKPAPPKVESFMVCNPNEIVMCPFCLFKAQLNRFFVSTKKGVSQGMASCPECHNGMRMKTLLAEMDATQYAEFVFGYRISGFWKKCPFEAWKKRLKDIGWSYQFWTRYKALKGDAEVDETLDGSKKQAEDYEAAYASYEESYK